MRAPDRNRVSRGVSNGVAGLGPLPSFQLPAAGGGRISAAGYRSRRHLVIGLVGAEPSQAVLQAAITRDGAIQAEGAELIIVLRAPLDRAEQVRSELGWRGPVLADADGGVHSRLAADEPTVLVAHRNSTIYWRAPIDDDPSIFDEAVSWLGYLNILEPECGTCVPAWPPELMQDR